MPKERLVVFIDTVLAIIITILALELPKPGAPTWQVLLDIHTGILAFSLSFFWLDSMWSSQHETWNKIDTINRKVVKSSPLMLYAAAWVPWATRWVNAEFYHTVPQVVYGIAIIWPTLANFTLNITLKQANAEKLDFVAGIEKRNRVLYGDLAIKNIGLVVSFYYPPAVMISLLVAAIYICIARYDWSELEPAAA